MWYMDYRVGNVTDKNIFKKDHWNDCHQHLVNLQIELIYFRLFSKPKLSVKFSFINKTELL